VSPVMGNEFKANCKVCHRIFSVAHGGLSDLKQHSEGDYHVRAAQGQRMQSGIAQFMIPQTSPEIDTVSCGQMCVLLLDTLVSHHVITLVKFYLICIAYKLQDYFSILA